MLKSKVLWTLACGTSIVIVTEIFHYFLHLCQKRLSAERELPSKVLYEVLWTNELSAECMTDAQQVSDEDSIIVSEENNDHKLCPNRFCSLRKLDRIIELIDSSQFSVDIAMYIFTSSKLRFALERAVKRGIAVRLVLDKDTLDGSNMQFDSLENCGIQVRFNTGTNLMHHKFCLVDSALRIESLYKEHNLMLENEYPPASLLTGSLNWTIQGIHNNWENTLIIFSKEIVNLYAIEFERIWLTLANNNNSQEDNN